MPAAAMPSAPKKKPEGRLFLLSGAWEAFLDELDNSTEGLPEAEYERRMGALIGQSTETIDDALAAWRQLEYQVEALKSEAERIRNKRQRVEKHIDRIKQALVGVIKGAGGKIQTPTATLSLGRSPETVRLKEGFPVKEDFGRAKTEWVLDQEKARQYLETNHTEAERCGLSLGTTIYPVRR